MTFPVAAAWLALLACLALAEPGLAQQHPFLRPPPTGLPPSMEGFGGPTTMEPLAAPQGVPGQGYMAEGLEEIAGPEQTPWLTETWLQPTEWDRSVELGLNSSSGNTEAFSLRAGGEMTRKTEWNEVGFDVAYVKASADGLETQHNALLNALYEQKIDGSRWTIFDKLGLEYDEFRAFDIRFWLNAGVGVRIIDTGALTLKGRFGAGASREFGGPVTTWTPEAVFGGDYEHKLSDRQKLSTTVDYFPAWEDYSDYRVVAVFGWEVLLSSEHDLSLKVSATDRYDSTPNGRKPNDLNYALLLLWKP